MTRVTNVLKTNLFTLYMFAVVSSSDTFSEQIPAVMPEAAGRAATSVCRNVSVSVHHVLKASYLVPQQSLQES